VTGGLVPEGCGWSNVFSGPHYLFADAGFNWIRALPVNAARTGVSSQSPIDVATFSGAPVSIRLDAALYVVYNASGAVLRFAPTALTGADCATPPAVPASSFGSTGLLAAVLAAAGALMAAIARRRPSRVR